MDSRKLPRFRVRNFRKFQHYKHRRPPWVKLYRAILDDYDFLKLTDAQKWHLVAIFLLQSESESLLKDTKYLTDRIHASEPVNLGAISHWLELIDASTVLSDASNASNTLAENTNAENKGLTDDASSASKLLPQSRDRDRVEESRVETEESRVAQPKANDPHQLRRTEAKEGLESIRKQFQKAP